MILLGTYKNTLGGVLAAIICFIGLSCSVKAEEIEAHCVAAGAVPSGTLKVAIRHAPPFIQEHPIRGLEGISIDLWESIARKRELKYRYVCLNLKDTLTSLIAPDGIDIAISPLTISRSREGKFDFSHQYFTSGLVFAGLPDTVTFDFKRVLETLLKAVSAPIFLVGVAVFAAVTLAMCAIAFKFRKHYNTPLDNPNKKSSVSLHFLLMSASNMMGLREDTFSFGTVPLQALFLGALMLGATLSASLGGMITASIMHSVEQGKNVDINSLDELRISTLRDSTAEEFLVEKRGGKIGDWHQRETWAETLKDVINKDADLVIGDWVQLIYLTNSDAFSDQILVDPKTIRFEPYGWGLPNNSPLRDTVNQELIGILRSEAWPDTVRSYIGGELL